MVDEQIARRGVRDERVLHALRSVPRHAFVPEHLSAGALGDHALPIGFEQTISQPYVVGKMTELLEIDPGHIVLEIGTGSGYQAAILSVLAARVYSVEIVPELASAARSKLRSLGYDNVEVLEGDGTEGWSEKGLFDRICLTAAPSTLPGGLLDQLRVGGRMVAPIGSDRQRIHIWDREFDRYNETTSIGVRFVPMTGKVAT